MKELRLDRGREDYRSQRACDVDRQCTDQNDRGDGEALDRIRRRLKHRQLDAGKQTVEVKARQADSHGRDQAQDVGQREARPGAVRPSRRGTQDGCAPPRFMINVAAIPKMVNPTKATASSRGIKSRRQCSSRIKARAGAGL